jgi:hypothetical protein
VRNPVTFQLNFFFLAEPYSLTFHQATVFLDYGIQRKLIIAFYTDITPTSTSEWILDLPLVFPKAITLSANFKAYPTGRYSLSPTVDLATPSLRVLNGLAVTVSRLGDPSLLPEVCFGTYLDKPHFCTLISNDFVANFFGDSPQISETSEPPPATTKSVCVLWDTSQSLNATPPSLSLDFFTTLDEAHKSKNERVTFTLFFFSTTLLLVDKDLKASSLLDHLSGVKYDGGTNLAILGEVFLGQRKGETEFDYFLLYTDGVDNVGGGKRLPAGISKDFGTPVHVLYPGIFF